MTELEEKQKLLHQPKLLLQKAPIRDVIFLGLLGCFIIGFFDGFFPLPYGLKSILKWVLFLGLPIFYHKKYKSTSDFSLKSLLSFQKDTMLLAAFLGGLVFFVILGAYYVTRTFVDLSGITVELETRMDINRSNFLAVALYIPIFNAFLEEFFFRGFLFFRIKEHSNSKFAHITSGLIFAIYHVPMVLNWFELWVFALCMVALVIGGVIFNLLNEKSGSLYPSWLTHGCANLAINLIGYILFYG